MYSARYIGVGDEFCLNLNSHQGSNADRRVLVNVPDDRISNILTFGESSPGVGCFFSISGFLMSYKGRMDDGNGWQICRNSIDRI